MSEPTPGPWTTGTLSNKRGWRDNLMVYGPDGVLIANCEAPKKDGGLKFARGMNEDHANAHLIAASPMLRDALFYAMHALEDANEGCFCECGICDECGKPVEECTGTDCSKMCQCSSCRYCVTEMAYEGAKTALAASAPPPTADAGTEDGA